MSKILILASVLLGNLANAQVTTTPGESYRVFKTNILALSEEIKPLTFEVNTFLTTESLGDPDNEGHNSYNYMITGTISEGIQSCEFEVLLGQGDKVYNSLKEVLKNKKDHSAVVKICSGLSVDVLSVHSLLLNKTQKIYLRAPGLKKYIGVGNLRFQLVKFVSKNK